MYQSTNPSLTDANTWQLSEVQYLRQGDRSDYVVGVSIDFFGEPKTQGRITGVQPPSSAGALPHRVRFLKTGSSPKLRLHANQIGRTVLGEAEPGTFVQLRQGLNGRVIAETIVNSSGLYRFEDVLAGNQLSSRYANGGYVVQLYKKRSADQ